MCGLRAGRGRSLLRARCRSSHAAARRAYKPCIAMAATHITAEAAINTKSGLSVDLPDFAMTIAR